MDKHIFQDLPLEKRVEVLSTNCERREDYQYTKDLSQTELAEIKNDLAKESIAYARLEDKKKEFMAELKAEMDPIKQEKSKLIALVRSGVEEIDGKVYLMADYESENMGYYTPEGKLVYQRPLKNDEKQYRITTDQISK